MNYNFLTGIGWYPDLVFLTAAFYNSPDLTIASANSCVLETPDAFNFLIFCLEFRFNYAFFLEKTGEIYFLVWFLQDS